MPIARSVQRQTVKIALNQPDHAAGLTHDGGAGFPPHHFTRLSSEARECGAFANPANTIDCFSAQPATPPDDPAACATPTRKGTVLWFDRDKGYGRIRPADGSRNIIVHQWAVERAGLIGLFPGQEVEFDLVPWVGYHVRAENLRLIAACGE